MYYYEESVTLNFSFYNFYISLNSDGIKNKFSPERFKEISAGGEGCGRGANVRKDKNEKRNKLAVLKPF